MSADRRLICYPRHGKRPAVFVLEVRRRFLFFWYWAPLGATHDAGTAARMAARFGVPTPAWGAPDVPPDVR